MGPTHDGATNFRLLRICTAQHRSDSLQCDFICYFTGQTGDYLPFPTKQGYKACRRRVEELLQAIGTPFGSDTAGYHRRLRGNRSRFGLLSIYGGRTDVRIGVSLNGRACRPTASQSVSQSVNLPLHTSVSCIQLYLPVTELRFKE